MRAISRLQTGHFCTLGHPHWVQYLPVCSVAPQ